MNKRLGTLIAALSLVAVAAVGNAVTGIPQPVPSPRPGPCFNVKLPCAPAPCSPTSPRSCRGVRTATR